MSAKILSFGKEQKDSRQLLSDLGDKIPEYLRPKPDDDCMTNARIESEEDDNLTPSARLDERIAAFDDWAHFARGLVAVSVCDWRELFLVAKKNFEWHKTESERVHVTALGLKVNTETIKRIDQCAAIYDEEMGEVEKLAQEARNRVADRIEKEVKYSKELANALRVNDPQLWARGLDWN